MKKLILSIICATVFYFAPIAYASITFDVTSPQTVQTFINLLCSVGNSWSEYDNTGNPTSTSYSGMICSSIETSTYSEGTSGTYTLIECDTSLSNNGCYGGTASALRTNSGFISETTFEFTAPETVIGCMDNTATNYEPTATEDTDPTSCTFAEVIPTTNDDMVTYIIILTFIIGVFGSITIGTIYLIKKLV